MLKFDLYHRFWTTGDAAEFLVCVPHELKTLIQNLTYLLFLNIQVIIFIAPEINMEMIWGSTVL